MRKAAPTRGGGRGAKVSISKSFPAPLGGLNARDSIADMKPTDAIVLNNWWLKTSYLEIRNGCADHLTGMTGTPKTLAVYNGLDGTNKMFAVTDLGVFDASSAGAVGASVAARTNAKHQHLNFGDGTNNYLMMFNGVDKPLYYNGTTWTAIDGVSTPALTGLTTTSIISAFQYNKRLFFLEINSLSFWYLAAGAAGGALTEFNLDGVAKNGGYLMAGATWTFDGGDGLDDAAVFITSKGEIIVYKGTNPGDATAWNLVGVFNLGEPIGRRCLMKFGGDLLAVTQDGVFPLSKSLSTVDPKKEAVTNKIENEINKEAKTYGNNFGWELTLYPTESALILNIPLVDGGTKEQYVMNTITKSWTRFTGWDAECFAVFNKELYFCKSATVVKAWTGTSDYGNNIDAYGKQAFSHFGYPGVQKHFVMYKPILNTNGSISFLTDLDVDFQDNPMVDTAVYSVISGATWDVSNWDESYWAAGLAIIGRWTSPDEGIGIYGAPKIKISTNALTVQWMASDVVFQNGGIL